MPSLAAGRRCPGFALVSTRPWAVFGFRRDLMRVTAMALSLRTARYCWNFSFPLDCECGYWHAWDTRSWQLPSAAGCGVSAPAARAECGVSSGASEFGDVAGAAERGLVWTRRWRGVKSSVGCQIRIVGSVHFPPVTRIKSLRTPNKSGLCPEVNGWWGLAQSGAR